MPQREDVAPVLPGYVVGTAIGVGGFSTVWAARRIRDGRELALKVGRSSHAIALSRFRAEAGAAARLGPPHTPALLEQGVLSDGRPYLLMERIAGDTLAARLEAAAKPFDQTTASALADALLEALEVAHTHGLVHRDLKPENVMIEPSGRVRLLDLGLAEPARADVADRGPQLTGEGAVVGTIEYLAPERLRGERADVQTDLYAFGVLMYELLTLRVPFTGEPAAIEHGHLAVRPIRPGAFAPVAPGMEALVLACLSKERERRPASASEARQRLAGVALDGPATRSASSTWRPLLDVGRQPMALLAFESAAPAASIVPLVALRKGVVARQRGRRFVVVFSGVDEGVPVHRAVVAARTLADAGAERLALHVARLRVHNSGERQRFYGAELEQPDGWSPSGTWSGLASTEAVLRAAPDLAVRGATEDGTAFFVELETAGSDGRFAGAPQLRGRDTELARVSAQAIESLEGSGPGLFVVTGEPGVGKSRFVAEVTRVLEARTKARIIVLGADAARSTAGDLLDAVGAPAFDASIGAGARAGLIRALRDGLTERANVAPLAVIVDDAERVDDAVLDALVLATLPGGPHRLWGLLVGDVRLARRHLGSRAHRAGAITLEPLDPIASDELAAELIAPAAYPAADALRRLGDWAGHNPRCLVELTRALQRAGMVRRRGGSSSWYFAADELERVAPWPAWQWLAARDTDAMPPELSACARVCALLGPEVRRPELEEVLSSLERAGVPATPLDAGAGLRTLAERGLLTRIAGEDQERYVFRSEPLCKALAALVADEDRVRIHRHALAYWTGIEHSRPGDAGVLGAIARHAAAANERELAARVFSRLGEADDAAHRYTSAESHYTAAIEHAGRNSLVMVAALRGRARIRYRLSRAREALEDLAGASAIAETDATETAEILLEEATALDWTGEWAASAARAERARSVLGDDVGGALGARLEVASGRSAWRQARVLEAIGRLERGAAAAAGAGDHETQSVALMLLACALVQVSRNDEAEARFEELIAHCERVGDRVNLGGAYVNRAVLWAVRARPEAAIADLARAVELAREVGSPASERNATVNLAEVLHWSGRDAEALELAERSRALEERFFDHPVIDSALLLARMRAMRGELAEATRHIVWIRAHAEPDGSAPNASAFLLACEAVVASARPAPLAPADLEAFLPDERLELQFLQAVAARAAGDAALADALQREACEDAAVTSVWRGRFDALRGRSTALHAAAGR